MSPAALSIITTTFAEGEDRAKALGVWSAIAAGGAAFGLLLGGILTDLLSWEWIFFVNVPIGIAAFLLSLRYVPGVRGARAARTRVDLPGAISVTAGLMVLVYAIVKAQDYGWGSARTLGLGAVADRAARRRSCSSSRARRRRSSAWASSARATSPARTRSCCS